jgi:hypothetical protein
MRIVKNSRNVGYIFFSIGIVLVLSLGLFIRNDNSNLDNSNLDNSNLEVTMSASWASNYENFEELTKDSDFIGLVEIIDVIGYETYTALTEPSDGREEIAGRGEIKFTVYSAKVLDSIVSDKESIEITMTGKKGHSQIVDDPLMSIGDKWFIFANKNDNGTYSILSGPQGRYSYNEANDTISSMVFADSLFDDSSIARTNENIGINIKDISLSDIKSEITSYVSTNAHIDARTDVNTEY